MTTSDRKDLNPTKPAGVIRSELIDQICKQIEPYLPLRSLDQLHDKVDAIKIGSQGVPITLIAPHMDKHVFPIKDSKDLRAKVSEGVAQAVSLGRSFRPKVDLFDRVIGELTQTEAKIALQRPAVHRFYYPD